MRPKLLSPKQQVNCCAIVEHWLNETSQEPFLANGKPNPYHTVLPSNVSIALDKLIAHTLKEYYDAQSSK